MSIVQIAQSLHWQGWHRQGWHWQGWHWQGWHRQGWHWHPRGDRGWFALVKMWWRRMQDRRILATMNDQSLRDIGITRYDAFYEARKPFWRA